jgi:phosphate starvation-inducible protein PhoH
MDKIRELKLDVNSDKKFIPEIYKNLSLNNKKELLKGLFDSDGTIGKNGNISYSTVSKQLAIDIQDILWSMGCICKIVETQKFYKDKNGDKKAGKLCYRLNVRTDKHSDLFHSPRKLERIPLNYQYNNLKLRIKEINLKSSEEAVCISIKDENKLYITDNYIVTHNTFIALVQAINLLLSHDNEYTKIRIFKPLKQLQNEDIGILPGGVEEKLEYVLMSYSMQLNKLLSPIALEILFKEKIIEIIPMGNLRGLSLDNINIFDEFQNVSVDNAETVLTRLEEDAKMIIIGDIRQRDFKDKKDNGLMFLSEHFKDFDDHVKIIEFVDSDCVRSPLIQKITKLFDEKKPI